MLTNMTIWFGRCEPSSHLSLWARAACLRDYQSVEANVIALRGIEPR